MFQNVGNHEIMDRKTFVDRIKNPNSSYHQDYIVKKINRIETPVSKPDGNKKNNLGNNFFWLGIIILKGENMKIFLGSTNVSKQRSILIAMNELGFDNVSVIPVNVNSLVNSKPINDETLIGAKNRNKNLYNYCIENSISFDLLISIEGGYEQIDDTYFIVTYASILDQNGNEFIGKSNGLQITERMFNYIKEEKSLNKVIESILNNSSNKRDNGITGYLTNGYYRRDIFESSAVISAMQSLLNYQLNYQKLEKEI